MTTIRAVDSILKLITSALKLRNLVTALDIPDVSHAILAAGHDATAIGIERHERRRFLMPQSPHQHTIDIPEARSAIMRCSEQKIACWS